MRDEAAQDWTRVNEALVAFTCVEKSDEAEKEAKAAQAADAIEGVAKQVKAERIVLYPFAHLSESLASPQAAVDVLALMKAALEKKGYAVTKSPFGWYKEFILHCKGHPLAELSRRI